jgi:hypothetical protein
MARQLKGKAKKESSSEKRTRLERQAKNKEYFVNYYLPVILALILFLVIAFIWSI